jgi:hypothetical protein
MKRSNIALGFCHLVGNALLLWLGYYWLGLDESDATHLAWSATVILIFVCGALWLHGTAMAMFNLEHEWGFGQAAAVALRRLLPLLVLTVVVLCIYGLLSYWHDSFQHKAFVIGSYATMRLRRPVPPSGVMRVFGVFIWILRWIVIPGLFIPLACEVVAHGWSGFRRTGLWRAKRPVWWLEICALLLVAILVPLKLVGWVPHLDHFPSQMVSFIVRLGVGYLLLVAGLLTLEFAASAGKPRWSQPSTVSSP